MVSAKPRRQSKKQVQLFLSHTKKDKDFCDRFDNIAARVGIKVFRSEFSDLEKPNWHAIRIEMNRSRAMFLLVGKELTKRHDSSISEGGGASWDFTQNWISFEIGLACQIGIDVWVVCEDMNINFPVPYLNNYVHDPILPTLPISRHLWEKIFRLYQKRQRIPLFRPRMFRCRECGAKFNLHTIVPKGMMLKCPTCLKSMQFSKGWLRRFSPTEANLREMVQTSDEFAKYVQQLQMSTQ